MQVRLAEHHGMCFGVRDAIDLARSLTSLGPVTIVGDLDDCVVLLDEYEAAHLRERFGDGAGARLGIVSQTTQPVERVRELVEVVKQSLPLAEIRFIDTVCQPTKDRQESLRALARE